MILFLLFIVFPITELFVIVQIGGRIGVLNTIGLLILVALIGSWLIKREGLRVWNRFVQQVNTGQVPTREIADGVCLLIAGALMLAPGFISDAVALLLIFPPSRAVFRGWLIRRKRLDGFAGGRVIKATYGGRVTDVTEATSTETRGELEQ